MGGLPLTGCLWTSNSDPRTGTFHKMQVTMGDTACIVKRLIGACTLYAESLSFVTW